MSIITTDPIADMLTRIRNAIGVRKSIVTMPHSNLKESVAAVQWWLLKRAEHHCDASACATVRRCFVTAPVRSR